MKMSRGRLIMILSLFAWCAYVEAGRQIRPVDCEKYVYHPHCRGIQAKKRVYPAEIKIDNTEQPCVCSPSSSPSSSSSSSSSSSGTKDSNNRRTAFSNSKLLDAMLNGLDMNTIYEAYAASSDRHRNYNDITRERNSQRRRQPIDINDLELLDY